jgi:poly(3-hydroxybutyrate) depolymerase
MIRNLLLSALVWAVSAHPAAAEVQALPALGAAAGDTSVSGISSGAYMAGQYQFAHARSVTGAAIIAGGPFGCAEARYGSFLLPPTRLAMNASQSVNGCMLNALSWYGIPDPAALAEQARDLSAAGKIDPIDALKRHRVYMFSGAADQIVHHDVVVAAAEVYLRLGVAKAQIKTGPQLEAGHGFVTEQDGSACARSAAPYVVKCGYDQAGDLLAHIYGPLLPKGASPPSGFITFDQRRFTAGSSAGLAETGAAYIPSECRARPGCRIHIAFHGCQQARAVAGDAFIAGSGYAGWAETNRIIVLFPQVAPDPLLNPLGCWDWWGYTGFEYLTKSAPQIAAVHSMVERLTSRAP